MRTFIGAKEVKDTFSQYRSDLNESMINPALIL
jgi:hypothetical protein